MDADFVDVHVLALCGKILYHVLVVSERVVAHVSVAVVVIPFRAVGMTSSVAHGHYDEAELGQTVHAGHAGVPGVVGGLYLRAGIYVLDDGIELGGVEVEGLVDDSPEVGHTVSCLGCEDFGILVAVSHEAADVAGFEVHDLGAGGIVEGVHRGCVHSRGIVYEVLQILGHPAVVVVVAGVEHLQAGAVETDAEEVVVVGMLVLVEAVGCEEYCRGALVHTHDGRYVICAFGQGTDELAVSTVQVELCPAVALGAHYDLAVLQELEVAHVDVGVQTLLDQYLNGIGVEPVAADVHAVLIAAGAGEVEGAVVTEPYGRHIVGVEVAGGVGLAVNVYGLVLEGPHIEDFGRLVLHVEEHQVALGTGLAGHLVLVGLEFGTGLGGGVDYPQLSDVAHVVLLHDEMLSVGRPLSPCGVSLVGVPVVDTGIAVAAVGHVLGAVSGEGVLDDGGVLLVLHGLAEVLHVHVPEVVTLGIDYIAAVGSDVGPAGEVLLLLLVGYIGQLLSGDVVFEMEDLLLHSRVLLGSCGGVLVILYGLLYSRLDAESESLVIFELEILERNVLGIEGILDDSGQLHGEFVHVEDCCLGLGSGIYDPVLNTVVVLPHIPELI